MRCDRRLDYLSATLTIIRIGKDVDPAAPPKQDMHSSGATNGKQSILASQSDVIYTGRTNGIRQSRRLQEGKNSRLQIQVEREWTIKDVKIAVRSY